MIDPLEDPQQQVPSTPTPPPQSLSDADKQGLSAAPPAPQTLAEADKLGLKDVAPTQSVPSSADRALTFPAQIGMGVVRGITNTVTGAGKLLGSAHWAPTLTHIGEQFSQPQTRVEDWTKKAEQMAEYFIPGMGEENFLKTIPALGPTGALFARAAYRFFATGALGAAQTSSPGTGAAIGGLDATTAFLAPAMEWAFDSLGTRIQLNKIKANLNDLQSGFDPTGKDAPLVQALTKDGTLSGSLRDSYINLTKRISDLAQQRATLLNTTRRGVPVQMDLSAAFDKAEQSIASDTATGSLAGSNQSTKTAFESLRKDIMSQFGIGGEQAFRIKVPLEYAEHVKEAMGTMADFIHRPGISSPAPGSDLSAQADVANRLYLAIRDSINDALPKGKVQNLNNEMAALMAVRRPILRQIPVDGRQAAISAMDVWSSLPALLSGNVNYLAIASAVRAQRYMGVGNWLVRNAQTPGQILTNLGKGASGMISNSVQSPMPPPSGQLPGNAPANLGSILNK